MTLKGEYRNRTPTVEQEYLQNCDSVHCEDKHFEIECDGKEFYTCRNSTKYVDIDYSIEIKFESFVRKTGSDNET